MKTAWYGEQKLKDAAMARLREDRRLDRIVQGMFWYDGGGCHLGCLTRKGVSTEVYEATERMFGISKRTALWLEDVFEGLDGRIASETPTEATT